MIMAMPSPLEPDLVVKDDDTQPVRTGPNRLEDEKPSPLELDQETAFFFIIFEFLNLRPDVGIPNVGRMAILFAPYS